MAKRQKRTYRAKRPLNNVVTITVGHPIVRPGVTLSTECTEEYVVPVTKRLIGNCRGLNSSRQPVYQERV
jgi:hypothetical protein